MRLDELLVRLLVDVVGLGGGRLGGAPPQCHTPLVQRVGVLGLLFETARGLFAGLGKERVRLGPAGRASLIHQTVELLHVRLLAPLVEGKRFASQAQSVEDKTQCHPKEV